MLVSESFPNHPNPRVRAAFKRLVGERWQAFLEEQIKTSPDRALWEALREPEDNA
jgi:hypothetical protein